MYKENFYVYELIDPRNNLPFYIGKGKTKDKLGGIYRRIFDHIKLHDKQNKFKNSIIKKLLKKNLEIKFNIVIENLLEEEALNVEIQRIRWFGKRIDETGILTNLTDGGDGISGYKHSSKTKEILSLKALERYKTREAEFKGKKHSQETRKLLSEIQKEICKYRISYMKGKKHTEETRKKISKSQKGKFIPPEICYKFANKGSKNGQAKKYIFISPIGEKFYISGEFKNFIKLNKLSESTMKDFLNKGPVPEPKNCKHNRMSENRLNSTGWEVLYDNA